MTPAAIASLKSDGFSGRLFCTKSPCTCCILILMGDKDDDFMNLGCARWLTRSQNCCALSVALHQDPKDPGLRNWPLDTVESAVRWLQKRGFQKIGILGISMQAAMALSAACRIPELSLVLCFSPADYVPWGFHRGRLGKSSDAEWPSGTSVFSWKGQPLPWQPAHQEAQDYWNRFSRDSRKYREMHSRGVFEYSESVAPIPEEAFIPAETIRGKLVLIGAEDDSMWNAARYIRRMEKRLKDKGFSHPVQIEIYPVGTHLLVPQGQLKATLPLIGGLVPLMFSSCRRHPAACRRARLDLDQKLTTVLAEWQQN